MYKRNLGILGVAVITFMFFVIAVWAFGFRASTAAGAVNTYNNGFIEINSMLKTPVNSGAGQFRTDSYALMVTGMVLSGCAVMFAYWGDFAGIGRSDWRSKRGAMISMHSLTIFFIFAAIVMMLAGELNFMVKLAKNYDVKFSDFWKTGYVAGMLIFTLLPLPMVVFPYMFDCER